MMRAAARCVKTKQLAATCYVLPIGLRAVGHAVLAHVYDVLYNIFMHEPAPSLIGICHVWIRNVRILDGFGVPNDSIPAGTVGDLEVHEIGTDGRVIHANFHPGGAGRGFGSVTRPSWAHAAFADPPSVAGAP